MIKSIKKLLEIIRPIWEKLISPSSEIMNPQEQYNARILIILFTIMLPPALLAAIILPITTGASILNNNEDSRYVFYSLGLWVIIYSLARSRFYKTSIWLAVLKPGIKIKL